MRGDADGPLVLVVGRRRLGFVANNSCGFVAAERVGNRHQRGCFEGITLLVLRRGLAVKVPAEVQVERLPGRASLRNGPRPC